MHEFPTLDMLGAGGDETRVSVVGDVVVVEIETSTGDAVGRGEGVELFQIVIAHEMCPQSAVGGPARIVDQDRHVVSLITECRDAARGCRDTAARAFAGWSCIR